MNLRAKIFHLTMQIMEQKFYRKQNYLAGFTFIELAVVMFITILLSSALILGASTAGAKLALKRTAYDMAQNLREVQEMSMSAKQFDCGTETVAVFGFYAEDKDDHYLIFADCDQLINKYTYGPQDTIIQTIDFEQGVKICNMIPPPPASKASICFSPPDPVVYLNGDSIDDIEVVIELCLESDESIIKRVIVNSVGMIEIQ